MTSLCYAARADHVPLVARDVPEYHDPAVPEILSWLPSSTPCRSRRGDASSELRRPSGSSRTRAAGLVSRGPRLFPARPGRARQTAVTVPGGRTMAQRLGRPSLGAPASPCVSSIRCTLTKEPIAWPYSGRRHWATRLRCAALASRAGGARVPSPRSSGGAAAPPGAAPPGRRPSPSSPPPRRSAPNACTRCSSRDPARETAKPMILKKS